MPEELRRALSVRKPGAHIRPVGDATIHRIHATLMSALNSAVKRKLIAANPARHVEVPTGRRPKAVVWTPARIEAWKRTGVRPAVAVWTAEDAGTFLDFASDHRLYPSSTSSPTEDCAAERRSACDGRTSISRPVRSPSPSRSCSSAGRPRSVSPRPAAAPGRWRSMPRRSPCSAGGKAVLVETGGLRVALKRRARAELAGEGVTLSRSSVTRRAVEIMRRAEARPPQAAGLHRGVPGQHRPGHHQQGPPRSRSRPQRRARDGHGPQARRRSGGPRNPMAGQLSEKRAWPTRWLRRECGSRITDRRSAASDQCRARHASIKETAADRSYSARRPVAEYWPRAAWDPAAAACSLRFEGRTLLAGCEGPANHRRVPSSPGSSRGLARTRSGAGDVVD